MWIVCRPDGEKRMMLVLALLSLVVPACGTSIVGVRGSGDVVSEARDVTGFDEVVLQGSGTVRIEVTGTESLVIEAEDNLMDRLTSDVVSGRLELGVDGSISPTEEIVYMITAANLEGVTIAGSGDATADEVTGARFNTVVSGSGDIEVPSVEVDDVSVRITGSGSIVLSGDADELEVDISGSGVFEGLDLVTHTADVTVSGSGDALVNVTGTLDARVSGSGDIEYVGSPAVDASTTGSGNIRRR